MSTINVGEWDSAYNNINKMIYKLSPDKYNKHKTPTANNDYYELCCDTSYFINLKDKNYVKVKI